MSERWRARIEQSAFEMPDGRSAKVTVSIGAAAFDSGFESVEELIGAADAALYLAKTNGRNRVQAHQPEP
jgi:diguanylate cyclase (GGDEF)-like protein